MAELRQNTIDLCDEIMSRHNFLALRDTGEVLYYENGIYKLDGETIIKEEAQRLVEKCTTRMRNEILNAIRVSTYVDSDAFDSDPMLVSTVDGILDMTTMKVLPHDPKIAFRTKLNARHDPKAVPAKFLRFLVEVIEYPHDRQTILEMFAAALLRNAFNPAKAVILVGDGANGKSVLLRTMLDVFGYNNASAVSTCGLLRNRFSKADLDSKMLNIYGDISPRDFKRLHELNGIIIGEEVVAKRKYKKPFMVRPYAKIFFTVNYLPSNMDDPIYKNFIIIRFSKQFKGSDCNPNILAELTTEEEKSGILNLLVGNARKLMSQGCLTRDMQRA